MQIDNLYASEHDSLLRLAARRVGRERAADAVQAAFVELIEGKAGDEDALTFLQRRVQNIARRETKRDNERQQVDFNEALFGNEGRKSGTSVADPVEPAEYEAGELFGFPFNSLGESTWS